MSRLAFDLVPEGEWTDKTRRVLDASFRALRSVLDVAQGGIRVREQFRCVDCVIDTGRTPYAVIAVSGVKRTPESVFLLSARVQTRSSESGRVISGAALWWEWREGSLVIHSADILSATTRYDCVIAVME